MYSTFYKEVSLHFRVIYQIISAYNAGNKSKKFM